MRRVLLASTFALLALPAAAAQAAQSARLDVAAKLLQQPVARPWSIDLRVATVVSTPDGGPPSPLRTIAISFPHATLNDARFPVCDPVKLERDGRPACSNGSKIGSGSAIADVRPLLDFPIHATIDVYNGPKRNGARMLVFDARAKEVSVGFILRGTLKRLSGRYGYRLTLTIPPIDTVPGANPAAISTFDVTVGGRRKGRSYLEAPRSCPGSGWPFAGTYGFADGSSASASAAISCTLAATSARG